jgi:acyl carrier protein
MHSRERLKATIVTAIADSCYLQADELSLDLPIRDLGLDSLAIASIVGELEIAWRCEFTQDDVISLIQAERIGDLLERAVRIAEAGDLAR